MGNRSWSILLCFKDLDFVFWCFLDNILVHDGNVVTLWMNVKLHVNGVLGTVNLNDSSSWDFDEINSWEHVFTCWERGRNQNVFVWSPHEFFKSFNIDGGSVSIWIFDHLHGRKLVNSDKALNWFSWEYWFFRFFSVFSLLDVSFLLFFLLFNFFLGVYNWDVLVVDLSNEFSVETPLIGLSSLITGLFKLSDFFKSHEVPDGIW